MIERTIEVERMEHVISVFGSFDQNLRIIESELGVKVLDRDNKIHVCGEEESAMLAEKAINGLLTLAARGENIDAQNVRYILKLVAEGKESKIDELAGDVVCITSKGKPVKAKTLGQKSYCEAIANNTVTLRHRQDLSCGCGGGRRLPCGGGKQDHSDTSGGRGGRALRLSAGRPSEQGRSLPAPALRCAFRNARSGDLSEVP